MPEPFYSPDEFRRRMATIHAANLDAPLSFWNASTETLRTVSNGIGPDRWPEDIREVVTGFLALYAEAAVVHDWEFVHPENDGSLDRWREANERFESNCRKLIRHKVSAWRFLRRLQAHGIVNLLMEALESPQGRKAWEEAFQRSQPEPEPGPETITPKPVWRSR